MGDKSPKAKQRDQKQKNAAKATSMTQARAKQEGFANPVSPVVKGRK